MPSDARIKVYFVTLEPTDMIADNPSNNGHKVNYDRLQQIADAEGRGVQVLPMHFRKFRELSLEDEPAVLCVYMAGTFPLWNEMYIRKAAGDTRSPTETIDRLNGWGQELRDFTQRFSMRTRIPILAVCGSHQLIQAEYAGTWDAVAHMTAEPQPAITIRSESAYGRNLPVQRIGEVGAFPFEILPGSESDPILEGLSGTLWFMEHHHDQVLERVRSRKFTSLLAPKLDETPVQDFTPRSYRGHEADAATYGWEHLPVTNPCDRCTVQLLRLDDSAKVLYTSEFHPELPCWAVSREVAPLQDDPRYLKADEHGQRLVLNFFEIARRFWESR
jgi:hypothetical protein